jgi:hypothetical protein
VVWWQDFVADGVDVDGAYRGEQVFGGAVASAVAAADDAEVDDLSHQCFDVDGVDVVQWAVTEGGDDVSPVGAVGALRAWTCGSGDLGDVLGEGRDVGGFPEKVVRGEAELGDE